MPYAHKLSTYRDDAFKNVTFCQVCGQDYDLAGLCPGEYVLTPLQEAAIEMSFYKNMAEIFKK